MHVNSDTFDQNSEQDLERDVSASPAPGSDAEEAVLTDADMDGVAGGFEFFPIPKIVKKRI